MKTSFLVLLCLLVSVTACKKNSDPTPADLSATLTAHTWLDNGTLAIIDGETYTGKNATVNGTKYTMGANASNSYTFKNDGTYTQIDDSGKETGTWKLTGTTLETTDSSGETLTATLSNVSDTGFTLSLPEVNPADGSDMADFETFLAALIVTSNGIDASKMADPKKIQIQESYIAK